MSRWCVFFDTVQSDFRIIQNQSDVILNIMEMLENFIFSLASQKHQANKSA